MNDLEVLNLIYIFNEKYMANDLNGIMDDKTNYSVINGKIPILLSAPHAVRSFKNGSLKEADVLTGPIVEFLCKETGANGIIRTYNLQDEPNSSNIGYSLRYKEAILDLVDRNDIKCMIDIHGCHERHPFDFEIGTNNGLNINNMNNFLDTICEGFATIGETVVDKKFKASLETNICNYISKKSRIPCFQVEINSKFRKKAENLVILLDCFTRIIQELEKQVEQGQANSQVVCRRFLGIDR